MAFSVTVILMESTNELSHGLPNMVVLVVELCLCGRVFVFLCVVKGLSSEELWMTVNLTVILIESPTEISYSLLNNIYICVHVDLWL